MRPNGLQIKSWAVSSFELHVTEILRFYGGLHPRFVYWPFGATNGSNSLGRRSVANYPVPVKAGLLP